MGFSIPNPFCSNIITSLPVLIAGLMISSQVMGPSGMFSSLPKYNQMDQNQW